MLFQNKEKRYFKKKLEGVQKIIWDLQFKRFKTKEIREEVRQLYDNQKSKLALVSQQIEEQAKKPTMEKGDVARLDDQKVLLEREVERYLAQMKGFDLEVSGSNPTNEYPNWVQGITDQIDALYELKGILEDYIRKEI